MNKRVVIALGGNALGKTNEEQIKLVNKTAKKMKNFAVNLVCLKFICLENILYQNSSVLNKKAQKKTLLMIFSKARP